MFRLAGKPILVNDMTLLLQLQSQLAINGIQLFHKFKQSSGNIQFCCPVHKDGQERKPSCGILTEDRDDKPAGTVHCFTCGYTATLEEMISHCFGYNDKGEFGKQWVVKNFVTVESADRQELNLDLSRDKHNNNIQYINEEELESYRYYHPYMYQRKLNNEIISKFDVGYDKNTDCITFPVRDLQGRTQFIARRGIASKFFHYPEDIKKPLYGVYELSKDCNEVIICESIFNALTCWVYGRPAIALLGLGSSYQYELLDTLKARKLVLALDPDPMGQRTTQQIQKFVNHKIISLFKYPDFMYENKLDINDLNKKEFDSLEEIY